MNMERQGFYALIVTLAIGILIGFLAGWGCKPQVAIEPPQTDVAQMISHLQPGETLVLDEKQMNDGGYTRGEKTVGPTRQIDAKDHAAYSRIASWFGLGAGEAAAKHEGMKLDKNGDFEGGTNKGYGILETTWTWFKDVALTVVIIAAIAIIGLLVLSLIPATSAIAKPLLTVVTSWIPLIGAGVVALFNHVANSKANDNFEKAVDAFPGRNTTDTGEGYTINQKAQIKTAYEKA